VRAALLLLLLGAASCTFEAEPQKACFYSATIGCGPGCEPRIIMQMIVCPNPPFAADAGSDR